MSQNPYRPPDSVVRDVSDLESTAPRPRAITVTKVIVWILVGILVTGFVRYAWIVLNDLERFPDKSRLLLDIAWRVVLCVALCLLLVLLRKRAQVTRWFGALFIVSFYALPIYSWLTLPPLPEVSVATQFGRVFGLMLLVAPITWWLYAFAFSRKARAYFNSVPERDAD